LEYAQYSHFHPLFLYESLWNFLLCGALLFLWLRYRDRMKAGDFFLLYVIGYSVVRFLLEFLRIEVTKAGGINVSQAFTAVAALAALAVFVFRYRATIRRWLSGDSAKSAKSARRST
jgi:phosphatidylglycerol:prolipoprotein diacylglycerol transferase